MHLPKGSLWSCPEFKKGSSVDLKQSAQGVSIEINKDPGVCRDQRLAAPSLHTIFLFSKTLGSSPHPLGGAIFIFPLSHLPSHKTWPSFPLPRHYPQAPPLPYSSQQLPSYPLSPLHSRVPSQRGHFTCFQGSGLFPLVLFIVGATLGLHLITWLWRSGGQPYGTIKTRGSVLGRLPLPDTRHCTDRRRNTP